MWATSFVVGSLLYRTSGFLSLVSLSLFGLFSVCLWSHFGNLSILYPFASWARTRGGGGCFVVESGFSRRIFLVNRQSRENKLGEINLFFLVSGSRIKNTRNLQ